jgi:hypothetical protein
LGDAKKMKESGMVSNRTTASRNRLRLVLKKLTGSVF